MTRILSLLFVAAACAAQPCGAAWTLQTEEGGDVLFPAGDAKFQPMRRRADDSFKRYVAKVEADSSDASKPRLRWTFPQRSEGEKNVIVLSLTAENWAGGKCEADAKTIVIPAEHEKSGQKGQTLLYKLYCICLTVGCGIW